MTKKSEKFLVVFQKNEFIDYISVINPIGFEIFWFSMHVYWFFAPLPPPHFLRIDYFTSKMSYFLFKQNLVIAKLYFVNWCKFLAQFWHFFKFSHYRKIVYKYIMYPQRKQKLFRNDFLIQKFDLFSKNREKIILQLFNQK